MHETYSGGKIKQRLIERGIPPSAEFETWEGIIEKTRMLGRQILEACEQTPVKEKYPTMVVLPRGGYFIANILSRTFGYGSTDMQHLALSSYRHTQRGNGFSYGQQPDKSKIESRNILAIDEVCDSGLTFAETEEILLHELGAAGVDSAVIHFKPEKSENGYRPDFFVETTNKWIVYPWEPYETLREESLQPDLWLPNSKI